MNGLENALAHEIERTNEHSRRLAEHDRLIEAINNTLETLDRAIDRMVTVPEQVERSRTRVRQFVFDFFESKTPR